MLVGGGGAALVAGAVVFVTVAVFFVNCFCLLTI